MLVSFGGRLRRRGLVRTQIEKVLSASAGSVLPRPTYATQE